MALPPAGAVAPKHLGMRVFWLIFLCHLGLAMHAKYSVDGDEPHYLIVAESLLRDGDMNLANNYARDDGARFGRSGVPPASHVRTELRGQLYPVHDIGLPILLVPVVAVARGLSELVPDAVLARLKQSRGLFAYSLIAMMMMALCSGCEIGRASCRERV